MGFALSKILGFFLDPLALAVLCALAAGSAKILHWPTVTSVCLWAGAVILILAAATPLGPYAAHVLETRYPGNPPLPDRIAGIIVLGGSPDVDRSIAWGQPVLAGQGERLFSLVALARRYPAAQIIYTGGYGRLGHAETSEAAIAHDLLAGLGFDTTRVMFEGRSRNTLENAAFSQALVGNFSNGPWVLVTGALHMPRAVAIFAAAGWPVIPYPVAPLTASPSAPWSPLNPVLTLALSKAALHEWLGLATYQMLQAPIAR